jgi:hypothetical protein
MHNEFVQLAQRKSLLEYCQRLLADRLIDSDLPAKERVLCEEVPFKDREVPQHVIQSLSEELQQQSHELQLEMNKFTFTKKVPHAKLLPKQAPSAEEGPVQEITRRSLKSKQRPEGAAGPSQKSG